MVLYVAEILAVFMLRGRPCSGETVITTLFSKDSGCLKVWVSPILVFSWNVILPIVLMVGILQLQAPTNMYSEKLQNCFVS